MDTKEGQVVAAPQQEAAAGAGVHIHWGTRIPKMIRAAREPTGKLGDHVWTTISGRNGELLVLTDPKGAWKLRSCGKP